MMMCMLAQRETYTRKHFALGLTLKSLTESRSVVSLMNRFGHCVGDEIVRRDDISLESNILRNEQILLSHIKKEKNLVTGLSWDNFDINIETLSGAKHYSLYLWHLLSKYKPMQQ